MGLKVLYPVMMVYQLTIDRIGSLNEIEKMESHTHVLYSALKSNKHQTKNWYYK